MLAVGPNGAGKTNLLESLHVGTQGFSPRTRCRRAADPLRRDGGAGYSRAGRGKHEAPASAVTLSTSEAKRATLNGARLPAAEQLRREVATLVFTPDRLAIVKGGPAARRAYFDRVLGATAARAGAARRGVRGGGRATQRCAPPRGRGLLVAGGDRALDRAGGDARRGARRRARGDARCARAGLHRARRRARPSRRGARLRRRAADTRCARGAARTRPRTRDDRPRPAPPRRAAPLRRPRPAQLRLAGRAAA